MYGRHGHCKSCRSELIKKYRKLNPSSYKPRHKPPSLIYDALAKERGERCEICKCSPNHRNLDVDHDHRTGKLRGLLCYRCRRMLGSLENKLRLHFLYLLKYNAQIQLDRS